jgi:hypothetical protein
MSEPSTVPTGTAFMPVRQPNGLFGIRLRHHIHLVGFGARARPTSSVGWAML